MQRFCALTVSRGREKKKKKKRRGRRRGEKKGKKRKEKRKEGVAPISVGFYETVAWKFRPFIISRHAPASQQYRPLTISGSHTTPSTATLRPRSNYRECRRGPLSCFPTSVALLRRHPTFGERNPRSGSDLLLTTTHRFLPY